MCNSSDAGVISRIFPPKWNNRGQSNKGSGISNKSCWVACLSCSCQCGVIWSSPHCAHIYWNVYHWTQLHSAGQINIRPNRQDRVRIVAVHYNRYWGWNIKEYFIQVGYLTCRNLLWKKIVLLLLASYFIDSIIAWHVYCPASDNLSVWKARITVSFGSAIPSLIHW